MTTHGRTGPRRRIVPLSITATEFAKQVADAKVKAE
jgi:hypothetical protein